MVGRPIGNSVTLALAWLFIKELAKCDLSTHLKTARECFIYKLCVDTLSIRLQKELTMIYSNVKTHYISGDNNTRLVRYDVIEKNSDFFLVKVIEEQNKGNAEPKILALLEEFEITRDEYKKRYCNSGFQTVIRVDMRPTFEDTILKVLQEHRNKLD